MYRARRFATRHSRGYERFYNFVEPMILFVLGGLSKLSGGAQTVKTKPFRDKAPISQAIMWI